MDEITTPPDLDAVRRALRPDMGALPAVLGAWARGEGPLADVPLLGPGDVAPSRFESLAGTVRVAAATEELVTVGAILEIPDGGGILLSAMVLNPHDLGQVPDDAASRQVLARAGARSEEVLVEVAALVGPVEEGGPVAGVGVVRPLVFADPGAFPHEDDPTDYDEDLRSAVRQAVVEDVEVVTDLGGQALRPMPVEHARIWSPIFSVTRAATAGLAARGAGQDR